jgi:hypothetical protein
MRIGHRLRKVLPGRVSLLTAAVLTAANRLPRSGGGTAFKLAPCPLRTAIPAANDRGW